MVGDGTLEGRTARYRQLARRERVDGVFLADLRINDPRIELLSELKLRAVTLNRPDGPSPFPAVCQDDARRRAAVEHLAGLGHTRIALRRRPRPICCTARAPDRLDRGPEARGLEDRPRRDRRLHRRRRRARHTRAARRARPADRDRLRQRRDGHRRPGGRARAAGAPPPTCRSSASRTLSSRPRVPASHNGPPDPVAWGRTATRVLRAAVDGRPADVELPPARLVVRASTAGLEEDPEPQRRTS